MLVFKSVRQNENAVSSGPIFFGTNGTKPYLKTNNEGAEEVTS
jgi:hypothetical protein